MNTAPLPVCLLLPLFAAVGVVNLSLESTRQAQIRREAEAAVPVLPTPVARIADRIMSGQQLTHGELDMLNAFIDANPELWEAWASHEYPQHQKAKP